jgi:hypothetical protein
MIIALKKIDISFLIIFFVRRRHFRPLDWEITLYAAVGGHYLLLLTPLLLLLTASFSFKHFRFPLKAVLSPFSPVLWIRIWGPMTKY